MKTTNSAFSCFQIMRYITVFVLSLLLLGCGTMYVDYDYEKEVDFSKFNTYQYDIQEGSGLSEFDERRFIKYTDSVLASKGYSLSDNPDLWMVIRADEFETQSRNTLGVGIGGGGGTIGGGVSGGIPIGGKELHQVIEVTFINNANDATIWEAVSESDIKVKSNPSQRDAHFKKLVSKIFNKYPPEQK